MEKRKSINDSGFTIVEAMVAVVILSIIFIPVTNSFISSIKASQGTKIMQEATSTTQNVMEEFKKKGFAELASQYTVTEGDPSTDTWSVLKMQKTIDKVDTGCCDFLVQVEVSKTANDAKNSGMNVINSVSMPVIYSIDAASSYAINVGETPDYIIDNFHTKTSHTKNTIRASVRRKFQISLEKDVATGNTHIFGKTQYLYGSSTEEGEAFDTVLSAELKNLYLFYVADYNGQLDILTFENADLLKGNFYVMGSGKNGIVSGFGLREQACTNLNKFHIATTVPIIGASGIHTPSVDAEFVPDTEAQIRRYEIKVSVFKKDNHKEYSTMTSTRGE